MAPACALPLQGCCERTMLLPGEVACAAALRVMAICTSRSLKRSRIQILHHTTCILLSSQGNTGRLGAASPQTVEARMRVAKS